MDEDKKYSDTTIRIEETPKVDAAASNVLVMNCRSCYDRGYVDAIKDTVTVCIFAFVCALTVREIMK